MSAAPSRSLEQRMDALQRANEIRVRRAQLKRDLRSGEADIALVLLDPPEYVRSGKVRELLMAAPKYGAVKVDKVLQLSRVSPSKTVGGLTPRQRTVLVAMLNPKRWDPAHMGRIPRGERGSATQHMRALAAANTTRLDRSQIKQQVAKGEKTVVDVLRERPVAADTMTLFDLLAAQHGWGRTRTRRFLGAIPLRETKAIGTLTDRQRGEVIKRWEYFDLHAPA